MRTEIATLGEFGLIKHLTEGIKLENESSKYGVGDDAGQSAGLVKKEETCKEIIEDVVGFEK